MKSSLFLTKQKKQKRIYNNWPRGGNYVKKETLYHAIEVNEDYYDMDKSLEKLEKIMQAGYLYSRRLQKDLDRTKGGFQGLDYISFCDNEKRMLDLIKEEVFIKDILRISVI